jgi:circadian clock protein KaiC
MDDESKALERFRSEVPGLDAILGGGMFVGGIYLMAGRPGLGKTLLANQIAFGHAAAGGKVVYVTLLAESHARLLLTLQQMSYFKREVVGDSLQYLSGFKSLEKGKLDGLIGTLRKVVRDHAATLLVVDGLVTAGALADSAIELKVFIHELQALVELIGCTCLLLTGGDEYQANSYAERTMVDGLISLTAHRVGLETVREIEIQKHRGSNHVMGASFYEISSRGLRIYPRLEATLGLLAPHEGDRVQAMMVTGVAGLDAMLGGGFRAESTTMVLGSPGSGKTLFGLSFLAAGVQKGEAGLYVGFFESPSRVVEKARSIGLSLPPESNSPGVEIQWHASRELIADRLAQNLLERLAERGVKRVFVDGLAGFRRAVIYPDRIGPFFAGLSNELRARGVTTVVSEEITGLYGHGPETAADGTSAMMDNIVFLRQTEQGSKLRRLISLVKIRQGHFDSSTKELRITDRGLAVDDGAGRIVARGPKKGKARSAPRG